MAWNYQTFDPLRTQQEYENSYNDASSAWAQYLDGLNNPSVPGATISGTSSMGPDGTISRSASGVSGGVVDYGDGQGMRSAATGATIIPPNPGQPNQDLYDQNIAQLQQNAQTQNSAYSNQMGGGWSGGVLPSDMTETYAGGGQFAADPKTGVRPTNPYATPEAAAYGLPGQATSGSYGGAQTGFGAAAPIGGFGGPFTISNPYA